MAKNNFQEKTKSRDKTSKKERRRATRIKRETSRLNRQRNSEQHRNKAGQKRQRSSEEHTLRAEPLLTSLRLRIEKKGLCSQGAKSKEKKSEKQTN